MDRETMTSPQRDHALPPAPTSGARWPWWLFRVTSTALALSGLTQAVLAGGFLSGHIEYLDTHANNATILDFLALLLVVVTVLVWRPGRGPARVVLIGVMTFLAIVVQTVMGYTRTLAIHIPLGVLIVAGLLQLLILAWRLPMPSKRS